MWRLPAGVARLNVVSVCQGNSPIILGQPHGGTFVPDDIFKRLNARGQGLDDTDWHINRLYDGLLEHSTVVQSHIHRYVIDPNRDPGGVSLYPGKNTTTLVPTTNFDGEDIWREGQEPTSEEIQVRKEAFHRPYHDALGAEIDRVVAKHGVAILFDCHSIRSEIPFLFQGQLPAFSIGTNNGETCDPTIESAVTTICANAARFNHVVNGRFKGGWTTRHYGQPKKGVHAIQMELAQRTYMTETTPWMFDQSSADRLREHLGEILHSLETLALSGALTE